MNMLKKKKFKKNNEFAIFTRFYLTMNITFPKWILQIFRILIIAR